MYLKQYQKHRWHLCPPQRFFKNSLHVQKQAIVQNSNLHCVFESVVLSPPTLTLCFSSAAPLLLSS